MLAMAVWTGLLILDEYEVSMACFLIFISHTVGHLMELIRNPNNCWEPEIISDEQVAVRSKTRTVLEILVKRETFNCLNSGRKEQPKWWDKCSSSITIRRSNGDTQIIMRRSDAGPRRY